VIDATDLRTLDNVARMIDPVIVTRAFDNDLLEQTPLSPLALTRRSAIDAGEPNGVSTEERAELRRRARTDARLVV